MIGKSDRLPDVSALAELRAGDIEEREWELKGRRHDPNDGEGFAVSDQFAPKHARIAIELAAPETLTNDKDVVAPLSAFFRAEGASANGLHA